MLEVQKFLLSFPVRKSALESLHDIYGIEYKEYDGKCIFSYSQIESPKYEKIVEECRGLILSADFTKVLCRPFSRFYNYGEGQQNQKVNFEKMKIFEKLDGTMLPLWFNEDLESWSFSTRKTIYAEGKTLSGYSIREIAEMALGDSVENTFKGLEKKYKDLTWIFEVVSLHNRVVKPYLKEELYLIGIRNNKTGEEYNIEEYINIIRKYCKDIKLPKIYTFKTIDDIKESFVNINTFDEGYVGYNEETNLRVKVKSPKFVAIAHMNDDSKLNLKSIAVLLVTNEFDEYLTYYPENRELFQIYIDRFNKVIDKIQETFQKYRHISIKKDFAVATKDEELQGILLSMFDGKTVRQTLQNMKTKAIVRLIQ